MVWVARRIIPENCHGLRRTAGRMQCNGKDISVSRLVRRQFGGTMEFAERLFELFEPHKGQPKRVVDPCITWNYPSRPLQHPLGVAVPAGLTIKIGEIDVRRCVILTQAQRRFKFGFGLADAVALRQKGAKPSARFGSICVEPLRRYELRRGTVKA